MRTLSSAYQSKYWALRLLLYFFLLLLVQQAAWVDTCSRHYLLFFVILFQSDKFAKTFGDINIPLELGYTWTFVKDYYHGRKFKKDGSITLSTNNGEADFVYHFFYNGYNAFVFLFPIGEKKSSRTKIIITDKSFQL